MKNNWENLQNHLFTQLDRLSDEEHTGEKLIEEISRAGAVVRVSEQIIAGRNQLLKAYELADGMLSKEKLPQILLG
jgi:hypothetical protein